MRGCVALLAIAACGRHDEPAAAPPPPASAAAWTCDRLPFAVSTPVPEASGAAWISFRGKPALFVISDSDNDGAYGIVDPESGETLAQGKIAPGDHGDDFEGVAVRAGKLYALKSNGYYVVITQDSETFSASPPVSIGESDKNFEGICLAGAGGAGECIGFAASKADGALYCLVEREGALVVDAARTIKVTGKNKLADCAIDERGALWAGANLFELGKVYRVDDWRDPPRARVTALGPLGPGNPEALAVRGDVFYRMSDTDGSPSMMAKFRCSTATK